MRLVMLIGLLALGGCSKPEGYISRTDLGTEWPLTVEDGVLRCSGPAILFETNGTTYAVNGTADTLAPENNWKDIREIWAESSDPKLRELGLKQSLGPLMNRAPCRKPK